MNLTFGGAGASGCGDWVNSSNDPSVPNCIYLIRAEQRYGNGDGIFTLEEQLQRVQRPVLREPGRTDLLLRGGNPVAARRGVHFLTWCISGSAEPLPGSVGPGCASTLRGQQ